MGIKGLIPKLDLKREHIRRFTGKRVAVDLYVSLHEASNGCAEELVKEIPTNEYVPACLDRLEVLFSNNVYVTLVADGRKLEGKWETECAREKKREEALSKARDCEAAGNCEDAKKWYKRAVDITPEMATMVMRAARARWKDKVTCEVAPYEADAQLAYLSRRGLVDCVVSIDSDMIPFGCERVLYKMGEDGYGDLYEKSSHLYLKTLDYDSLVRLCVLTGCDYLPSPKGIGISRAYDAVITDLKTSVPSTNETVLATLKMQNPKVDFPEDYIDGINYATFLFKHQIVYDGEKLQTVHIFD